MYLFLIHNKISVDNSTSGSWKGFVDITDYFFHKKANVLPNTNLTLVKYGSFYLKAFSFLFLFYNESIVSYNSSVA